MLGFNRGVAFVEIGDRPSANAAQPLAKRAGPRRQLALAPARVQWQANDNPIDVVFLDEFTIMTLIKIRPAPLVELEGKGNRAAGVAEGRPNTPGAEIDTEDSSHDASISVS